jgi:ATP-dependent HslUV protease subunit HslV
MTTILAVRRSGTVAIGGDGQVTLGDFIEKSDVNKIRKLLDGKVIIGFAGGTADAFALLDRFEIKLKDYPGNLARAATELAKDWRTDKMLRRLEAVMIAVDSKTTLLISGTGDVLAPSDGVLSTGSGGNYARSAARALLRHSDLSAKEIVAESLKIAAEIDIYTSFNFNIEELAE